MTIIIVTIHVCVYVCSFLKHYFATGGYECQSTENLLSINYKIKHSTGRVSAHVDNDGDSALAHAIFIEVFG